MPKIIYINDYITKREQERISEPLGMLRCTNTEKLYRCYIFEDEEKTTYKLMSKITRHGAIFYVLYDQWDDEDGERWKYYVDADIVYSKRTFSKRIADMRKRFGLKLVGRVNL